MTSHERVPDPLRLPDDAAHRILARAIELDVSRPLETSLDDLRDIAKEAGISADAFEQAVTEFRALQLRSFANAAAPVGSDDPASEPGMIGRVWNRLAGSRAKDARSTPSVLEALTTNVVAFGIFFLTYGFANRITYGLGAPWEVGHLIQILADIVGVAIAVRLNARFVAFGLAGIAVAQLAKYLMHLGFGIEAVQGGPTQLAVMIAGVLGATIGGLIIAPRVVDRAFRPPNEHTAEETAVAARPATEGGPKRLLKLRAGTI